MNRNASYLFGMSRRLSLPDPDNFFRAPSETAATTRSFEVNNPFPPCFAETQHLWDELNAAIVKAIDRANHKFTRNARNKLYVTPQSAHHIFLILDEGVAWMGSTILTKSAIFHQNPYLACLARQVELSGNVVLAFNPGSSALKSHQVDHLTATVKNETVKNEKLTAPHLTTTRDTSGAYKEGDGDSYGTHDAWKEISNEDVSGELAECPSQQWLLLTLTKNEAIEWINVTHNLPIGSSSPEMKALATNIPAALSESQLVKAKGIEASLYNTVHVFDFRSGTGGWPDDEVLELGIHVHPESLFSGTSPAFDPKTNSYLPEAVATDNDLSFFLRADQLNSGNVRPYPFASSRLEFRFRMGKMEAAKNDNDNGNHAALICRDESGRVFLSLPGIESIRAYKPQALS